MLNITDARNPVYTNDHSMINLEINHPTYGWIPFTASPDDVEAHGKQLFARAQSGEFGTVEDPLPPSLETVKTQKLTQIEQDKLQQMASNVTVHGRPWQTDFTSVSNLTQEIMTVQAGVLLSPFWRDANNESMLLTSVQQLIDIASAIKTQKLQAYSVSWDRKAAVEAATTVEQVHII